MPDKLTPFGKLCAAVVAAKFDIFEAQDALPMGLSGEERDRVNLSLVMMRSSLEQLDNTLLSFGHDRFADSDLDERLTFDPGKGG